MQDTWVRSLDWEDPMEKGKVPTPVFWSGEFHGLYSPWGHKVRYHFVVVQSITCVQFFMTPCHCNLSSSISGSLFKNLLDCVGEGDSGMI